MRYDIRVALLFAFAGFALGIASESLARLGIPSALAALSASALLFLLYAARPARRAHLLAGAFMLAAAAGVFRASFVERTLPGAFAPSLGSEVEFMGRIAEEPDLRETSARLTVEVEEGGATTRILAVAPLHPESRFGDRVLVRGTLEAPEPFSTDGGRVFRYDRFLAKDGIFAIVPNAEVEAVAPREGVFDAARGSLSDLKFAGVRALSAALPEPHASLAAGLILGGKQGLGEELLDAFVRTGLVHIVVLSGYNVMIVAEAALRAAGFMGKRAASGIAGAIIALFVLASGAGAASVRAGLMAGIALYGRATGRTYAAFRALMLAGALMLLWNPLLLTDDPGFGLSFMATLGLVFGAPLFERWLAFVRPRFLREIVAATCAAQTGVLPLLLYQNGLFSLVALPANALVLPLVPLAMLASFLAMLAGLILPAVAPLFGIPAYALLSYVIGIAEAAASLPLAAFTVPAFPFALVVAAYAALGFFVASRAGVYPLIK